MRKSQAFYGLLFFLATLTACQTVRRGKPSEATFAGIVEDNLGRPIVGAIINIAGATALTGNDGRFRLAVIPRASYGVSVRHSDFAFYSGLLTDPLRDGLFRLTRATRVVADPTHPIVLRDSRRPEDCIAIASIPGSELHCGPGFAIEIPPNALVDTSGNRPSGMVEVKVGTFEIQTESMPGPLLTAASDSDPTDTGTMTSFGAGTAELRDVTTGRELNLAPGSRAHIEIPVHRVARARTGGQAPPATIPLYRFNRGMLRWVRIGTMALAHDSYSADVDHLTDWNADIGYEGPFACLFIQFFGDIPSQVTQFNNPQHVRIEVLDYPGYPPNNTPNDAISFYTTERGSDITLWGHTLYALIPGHYYWGKAFNDLGEQLTDDNGISHPWTYAPKQYDQDPILPVSPVSECTHLNLYWDPNAHKTGSWNIGDLKLLGGPITFRQAVPVIRSFQDQTVIERVAGGDVFAAIGLLRGQPWIVVRTPRGQVGLVPRAGADLSRTRRPLPPQRGPNEDGPREQR